MSRCKGHKNLIKEAVIACNNFPASHSSNTMALKKIGITLSDFGHGEAEDPYHQNEQDLKSLSSSISSQLGVYTMRFKVVLGHI